VAAAAAAAAAAGTQQHGTHKHKERLEVVDMVALAAAIADVRSDTTDCDWVLAGWEEEAEEGAGVRPGAAENPSPSPPPAPRLAVRGSGSGGLAEMTLALQKDGFNHGMVRVTETIDQVS
jgi:hypothetical protein